MALQTCATVFKNDRVQSCYYLLELNCPAIADEARPGQFVMLKVSDPPAPLLRRPFSIYKRCPSSSPHIKSRGRLSILYKNVGMGTQKMTGLRRGESIDLIGPLGNGFTVAPPSPSQNVILIGGGVGIVSLHLLAEALEKQKKFVFVGGKTRDDILCVEAFQKRNSQIYMATEDGTLGFQGTVIDLFLAKQKELAGKMSHPWMYACGPMEMIKKMATRLEPAGLICQVSLEARMACGFGACWGCVVKTTHLETPYQRVCKEGPVFYLKDLVWD